MRSSMEGMEATKVINLPRLSMEALELVRLGSGLVVCHVCG
jgi:hypothetical protein